MAINDGGSAFPLPHQILDANDPLFKWGSKGMSLRDYFAAKALQSLTVEYFRFNGACFGHEHLYKNLPEHAYQMADAMLAAKGRE